jgi:two-component system CheB/CheR fusion protein
LQKKLAHSLFHYALNPGGMLFLGTSETHREFGDLFAVLDRKAKLYQRKPTSQGAQRAALGRFLSHGQNPKKQARCWRCRVACPMAEKLPLRELTEQTLLQQVDKAAALVNANGDMLYLHGRTGMYLEPARRGRRQQHLENGARRPAPRPDHGPAQGRLFARAVQVTGVRVKTNGHLHAVNLAVCRSVAQGPAAAVWSPRCTW